MKRLNKDDPNYAALKLKREAQKIEIQSSVLGGKAYRLFRQVEEICIHNETEKVYKFEAGSYYDRCVYINQIVCTVCGKIIEETRETGGYG